MPELPEVETVRQTLKKLIIGKQIRDIDVFYPKMIRSHTPEDFSSILEGCTFVDIRRYGKYLQFDMGDFILFSHLRMEGKFLIKPLDQGRDKHEHVIFYFNDGTTLRYHDTRKFGTFDLIPKDELIRNNPTDRMGPEPGSPQLTTRYLLEKFSTKTIAIKSALLDQTIISGLGNIYVNEVLFLAKIHPETPCNLIPKKQIKDIVIYSKTVIDKAIELGGTSIRSYTDSLGVTGRFQNELFVHSKEGDPCLICGTPIEKIKVGGRGTYYCPRCQQKRKNI